MRFQCMCMCLVTLGVLSFLMNGVACADVKLPSVIGSSMVLQRDMAVPVWGWAEAGEEVTVKIAGNEAKTTADASGKWMVKLPAMSAGGPHEMTVSGKNTLTLTDILIGEVWMCSGQSNMDMGINGVTNGENEVAEANYPNIRLFYVPLKTSPKPENDVTATWLPCSPENLSKKTGFWGGGFSATAYFFGREIHKNVNVPVGLIHTAWGGTMIQPWTPPEGFQSLEKYADIVKQINNADSNYMAAMKKILADTEAWIPTVKKALEVGIDNVPAPPAWPGHELNNSAGPTGIYNAMIHPLCPFAIRGALWYQGESNRADGLEYTDRMKALINGWRKIWGEGDFPFYFVQIAPFRYGDLLDTLMLLWEAQTKVLSVVPNTGMCVITDSVDDIKDIHPKNKQAVGKRLSLWALAKDYGMKDVVYSGPLYKSMAVEGKKIRLQFDYAEGLKSRDKKPLTWFTIAGEDKKFVAAKAKIEDDTIVVSSKDVPNPVAVRFGWNQEANPNLANKAGLPASPFRTDQW